MVPQSRAFRSRRRLADRLAAGAACRCLSAGPVRAGTEVCPIQQWACTEIGMSAAVQSRNIAEPSARVRLVEHAQLIAEGVTFTGPIPRVLSLEDTGGPFFLDAACTQPDPLDDDQALFLEAEGGLDRGHGLRACGDCDQHVALRASTGM